MTAETYSPDDILLSRKLIAESEAARAASLSVSTRNTLLGSAAVVAAAGVGLAAIIWSWNQGVDPEALKQALAAMPPIKVEATLDPNAKVRVEEGKVVLAPGGTVGIDPKAEVAIKSGGKIGVEGSIGIAPGSTVAVTGHVGGGNGGIDTSALEKRITELQNQPKGSDAIKRTVTVFNMAPIGGNRSVVTGWDFPTGDSTKPTNQFCYYNIDSDGGGRRIDLVIGGRTVTSNTSKVPNFNAAVAKCQWWNGAA